MTLSRRQWMRRSLAGAAGVSVACLGESLAEGHRPPASEQVRLGIIGTGFRGKYLIGNLPPAPANDEERRFWPVTMRYADGVELRFVHEPDFIVFHGEKGRLRMRRNFFETDPPNLVDNPPDAKLARAWTGSGHVARPHLQNWLDCLHTGKTPNAPVEAGHRTATICHLASLARQIARPLRWDPVREQFLGDREADGLTDRPRRKGFELPAS